ncbi:MAG: hypothetical protein HUJ25_18460 [Crocinitomicaceae bacterium]|nr:hypothetical protein [Crocinitomicaceae bacterium]
MKNLAFFTFLFPILVFSQKPECDCYKVYTGRFYTLSDENDTDTTIIERTKDQQIEYSAEDPADNYKLKIIWLNDCKYILRNIRYNYSSKEKIMKGDVVAIILETNDEYYKVKAWLKGEKKHEFKIYFYPEE